MNEKLSKFFEFFVPYIFQLIIIFIYFQIKANQIADWSFTFLNVEYISRFSKYLSVADIERLASHICIFSAASVLVSVAEISYDFLKSRKELKKTFLGEFSQYKKEFKSAVLQQFISVGFAMLLVISYLKTVKTVANPFEFDFYYLALLVHITIAGVLYGLRYLPLFIYSLIRKY